MYTLYLLNSRTIPIHASVEVYGWLYMYASAVRDVKGNDSYRYGRWNLKLLVHIKRPPPYADQRVVWRGTSWSSLHNGKSLSSRPLRALLKVSPRRECGGIYWGVVFIEKTSGTYTILHCGSCPWDRNTFYRPLASCNGKSNYIFINNGYELMHIMFTVVLHGTPPLDRLWRLGWL